MTETFYAKSFRYDTKLFTIRGHGRAMNKLYRKLGERHKKFTIRKHFKNVPETRATVGGYHYERRSRRWKKIKLRIKGHTKPNLFSGDLQEAVVSGSKVAATQRKFSFPARAPFPLKEKRREELEVISKREKREYTRWLQRIYPRTVSLPSFQEFKSKKIKS